jgi:hypothetical protein
VPQVCKFVAFWLIAPFFVAFATVTLALYFALEWLNARPD